jgi:hypothetical protein
VIAAAGIALAAIIWAWTPAVSPEMLEAALEKMPPIKVETSGVVSMKEGTVTLKDGVVSMDPERNIVRLDTSNPLLPPTSAPAQTADGSVIRREVTVFSNVDHADGTVVSGWTYSDGASTRPTRQFCYFSRPTSPSSSARIELGVDGRKIESIIQNHESLPSLDDAFSKCVWWTGQT